MEKVIVADIEDWPSSWGKALDTDKWEDWPESDRGTWFGRLVVDEVDDLKVFVKVVDFEDNFYGRGGPLTSRPSSGLPLTGIAVVSRRLLAEEDTDYVLAVMTHELGHVLGIGISSRFRDMVHLPSKDHPGKDAHFRGKAAWLAFLDAGGRYRRLGVPLQNRGSGRDAHWRGSHVPTSSWPPSPTGIKTLSAISVQALAVLGYEVDPDRADPYRIEEAAAKIVAGESRWRCGVGTIGKIPNPPPRPGGEF